MSPFQLIHVRSFKWPYRPTSVAVAHLLGEDEFGRWLGVSKGNSWWAVDHSESGVFGASFVKVIPPGTFWTACFNLGDPVVDVDIVLPVQWADDALEEVDLELDVLRFNSGEVRVRDRDKFDEVRASWAMPGAVATQAEETCERIRHLIEAGAEPFGSVGQRWLTRYVAEAGVIPDEPTDSLLADCPA
jgi:hypothetical protein